MKIVSTALHDMTLRKVSSRIDGDAVLQAVADNGDLFDSVNVHYRQPEVWGNDIATFTSHLQLYGMKFIHRGMFP